MPQTLQLTLHPHPASAASAATQLVATVERPAPDTIRVRFRLTADMRALVVPPLAVPARADELWRTTCFELFVQASDAGEAYSEFNFSPSSRWAAYDFAGYRLRRAQLPEVAALSIATAAQDDALELAASLTLPAGSPLVAAPLWRIAPTAVIEQRGGHFGWWALAHPPGHPDFHDSHCFAAELRAAQGA